jgi:hypothetical protein
MGRVYDFDLFLYIYLSVLPIKLSMKLQSTLFLLCLSALAIAQNQVPQISNVNVVVPWNTGQVIVTYDLADTESDAVDVKFTLSNNGENYVVSAGTVTGDVGFPITPGTGKQIIWSYDTVSTLLNYSIRLVADDKQIPNIQDIVDQVDSVLLRNDLEYVASEIRHYSANPTHLEDVKDTIEQRFSDAGLEIYRQDFDRAGYVGQNIIGKKVGLGSEAATFYVDAHFDTVSDAPGADDNGSGVVGFLEALRVLAPYNFEKTIKFIGFDFEESVGVAGTYGSLMYTQSQIPDWEIIEGVANYEMIGYFSNEANTQQIPTGFNLLFPNQYAAVIADSSRGNFLINAGDPESGGFRVAFDTLSAMYVPDLKIISIGLPNNGLIAPDFRRSDHANFWDIDAPALLLTDGANFRNLDYHTPNDTVGALNFTFMSNIVKGTVATIATLAGLQHSSYFDTGTLPAAIPESNFVCDAEVFPNPVKNKLTLKTGDCFQQGFNLTVVDIQGKLVKSEKIAANTQSEISFENIPSGNYFVVMEDGGKRSVKKVVVE